MSQASLALPHAGPPGSAPNEPQEDTAHFVPRPSSESNAAACLVTIYPTGAVMGQRHVLERRPLLVGRSERNDVHLPDLSVSRCHACIEPDGDGYRISDLDSTNGTFVNDRRVTDHRLADGDYLRFGGTILRFLAGGNVEAQYHQELYRLSIYDGLTGIPNQRALLECLQRELARSARHTRPLALLLLDIDHFKRINDSLGHLGGDLTLQHLAQRLKEVTRKEEVVARYGGEEFVVLAPDAAPEQARGLAERLRCRVADEPFRYEGYAYPVTISLGVAHTSGDPVPSPREFIRQADENLYRAKEQGRNRVVA